MNENFISYRVLFIYEPDKISFVESLVDRCLTKSRRDEI